jgi:TRAP-type C4-dicarboxylate transport system permease small subunit
MGGLAVVKRAIHGLSYWACVVGMFLIIPLMLMTTWDVISRSFFNKPVKGSFEVSEYMLSVIILLAAAYTQQMKGHVWVDFFTVKFSKHVQNLFKVITDFASLIIIAVLVVMGFIEAHEERTVSDMLRIPQWPFKMLVCFGGLLLWLELLVDFFESVARAVRRES